jgi:hypothetical protein
VRSKSNERADATEQVGAATSTAAAEQEDSEYLKTIKLRMSRPTRMTVTDEINRINI